MKRRTFLGMTFGGVLGVALGHAQTAPNAKGASVRWKGRLWGGRAGKTYRIKFSQRFIRTIEVRQTPDGYELVERGDSYQYYTPKEQA